MMPNPPARSRSKSTTMNARMLRFATAAATCLVAASATGQIYRCSEGDTTVFSDIPCSESAELHDPGGGISVVAAPEGLDEISAGNRLFLERRQEQLAQRRERAAQRQLEIRQAARRREAAEEALRYRTVIGQLGVPGFDGRRPSPLDPRTRAMRDRDSDDEGSTRRTLLSRSGGNQRSILR